MVSCRNMLAAWHRWDGKHLAPMLERTAELVKQVDADVPPDAREGWYGSRREPLAGTNPDLPSVEVLNASGRYQRYPGSNCRRCGKSPSECLCDDGYQE